MSVFREEINSLKAGVPQETNTLRVDFSTTATTSGLTSDSTFRLLPNQDCMISMIDPVNGTAVSLNGGVPLIKNGEYFFSTDKTHTSISVIRVTADGNLWVTKMTARHTYIK